MIERLTTNLGALARLSPAELATERGSRVAADCADAIRLELDCPQQELTSDQRELLAALGDLLDTSTRDERVVRIALAACRALGVRPREANASRGRVILNDGSLGVETLAPRSDPEGSA